MITIDKKGEIRSFTDQVRVICVKNGIDKPSLGGKIGMDDTIFFNSIKNNSLKIDPETYFKLEKEICGKDEHYRSKLRKKYEKTLDISEMGEYMKASEDVHKRELSKRAPKHVNKTVQSVILNTNADDVNAVDKTKTGTTDKESKRKFYKMVLENRKTTISVAELENTIGYPYKLRNMKGGWSCIPTKVLPKLLDAIGLTPEDPAYKELVELQLSCIAGPNEERELADYEKIFGSDSVEVESNNTAEEIKEEKEVVEEMHETNDYQLKDFADILTKWLFMKGYTLKQTARNIGCSEQELKMVVNGDICLSPYHVERFKETLGMDEETINTLVQIANRFYKGHEIPESILKYISSDMTIISAISEIARQNKPAQFWDDIWKRAL